MVDSNSTAFASEAEAPVGLIDFEAVDATGTQEAFAIGVERELPAASVASALSTRMSLPQNVPWALHNSRGAFLDEERPIGDQISPGERLTVTPKAHLG